MPSGFTETGFKRDNLQQIILDIENDVKIATNNPKFSIENSTNMGMFLKVFAGRENNFWQALEQAYRVWTINGAEGPFLDEVLALRGVFRENATAGSGFAVVETNSQAIDTTTIPVGTLFRGENGAQYAATANTLVSERVTGWRIDGLNASLATYNVNVTIASTGENFSSTFTLAATSQSARITFLNTIKTFLETNIPTDTVYIDETNVVLYWGFDAAYELEGSETTVQLRTTPSLGNRYSLVECVNTEVGFNPLGVGQIKTMSVLPIGYVSVTNLTAFSAGTDIETDAAFIERARTVGNTAQGSTRAAIVAGLLANVEGIEKVRFFKSIVDSKVVLTPVIIGGTIEDIAVELERTQPINNKYTGDISYTVTTVDSQPEIINFSRGLSQDLSIRVTYSTTDNSELSTTEQTDARNSLVATSETWQLGRKIFNFSLTSSVASVISSNRFSTLLVEVKKLEDPDSAYTSSDYITAETELPQLQSGNITFVRTII